MSHFQWLWKYLKSRPSDFKQTLLNNHFFIQKLISSNRSSPSPELFPHSWPKSSPQIFSSLPVWYNPSLWLITITHPFLLLIIPVSISHLSCKWSYRLFMFHNSRWPIDVWQNVCIIPLVLDTFLLTPPHYQNASTMEINACTQILNKEENIHTCKNIK